MVSFVSLLSCIKWLQEVLGEAGVFDAGRKGKRSISEVMDCL